MKNRTEAPAEKLIVNKVPEKMLTYLTMEFITKLPLVAGEDAILVIYDRLSKMVYFVVTTKGTLAEKLARLFRDNV